MAKGYNIKWYPKIGEPYIDDNIFSSRNEAVTYANIESTQMEHDGDAFAVV
jgi:hypothetical protein